MIHKEFVTIIQQIIKLAGMDDYMSDSQGDEDVDDASVTSSGSERENRWIVRLSQWKHRNGSMDERKLDETGNWVMSIPEPILPVTSTNYPDEVRFYKVKAIWEHKEHPCSLDEVISDADMKEISRLTGCTCVKHQNRQLIFLGTDTEEKLRLAIHKLNIVRKQAVSSLPCTTFFVF
jgi:hypothetical protein